MFAFHGFRIDFADRRKPSDNLMKVTLNKINDNDCRRTYPVCKANTHPTTTHRFVHLFLRRRLFSTIFRLHDICVRGLLDHSSVLETWLGEKIHVNWIYPNILSRSEWFRGILIYYSFYFTGQGDSGGPLQVCTCNFWNVKGNANYFTFADSSRASVLHVQHHRNYVIRKILRLWKLARHLHECCPLYWLDWEYRMAVNYSRNSCDSLVRACVCLHVAMVHVVPLALCPLLAYGVYPIIPIRFVVWFSSINCVYLLKCGIVSASQVQCSVVAQSMNAKCLSLLDNTNGMKSSVH